MKMLTKTIVLLSALLILVGAYCCTQQMKVKTNVKQEEESVPLSAHTKDDLTGLSWTQDSCTYSFRYSDNTWITEETPAWPVKQSELQTLADKLLGLKCSRTLKDAASLGDYGLQTPVFSVTAYWKDGSSTVYHMGSATPFKDGYYMYLSDQKDVIYTVATSLSSVFNRDKKKLAQMEEIPAVSAATRFSIGQTINAEKKEASVTTDPAQLWYLIDSNEPLDEEQAETLAASICALTWNDLVTAASTPEERKAWKLEDGTAVKLTAAGTDGASRTIFLGEKNKDGDFYACLPESNMVYTIKASAVGTIPDTAVEALLSKKILPIDFDTLQSVKITADRLSVTYPANTEKTDEEAASGQIADNQDTWKELWSQIMQLRSSERLKEQQPGSQILNIQAVTTGGTESTLVIYEHTADNYQAVVDGKSPVLVSADAVDRICRMARTLK